MGSVENASQSLSSPGLEFTAFSRLQCKLHRIFMSLGTEKIRLQTHFRMYSMIVWATYSHTPSHSINLVNISTATALVEFRVLSASHINKPGVFGLHARSTLH